jgi:hypothetical protein
LEQLRWQQKLAIEQAGLLMLFVLSKHGATPVYACPNFISFSFEKLILKPYDLFSGDSCICNEFANLVEIGVIGNTDVRLDTNGWIRVRIVD